GRNFEHQKLSQKDTSQRSRDVVQSGDRPERIYDQFRSAEPGCVRRTDQARAASDGRGHADRLYCESKNRLEQSRTTICGSTERSHCPRRILADELRVKVSRIGDRDESNWKKLACGLMNCGFAIPRIASTMQIHNRMRLWILLFSLFLRAYSKTIISK